MYIKPRPLPFSTGGFLDKKYSKHEIDAIRKSIRKWAKPYSFASKYYHITDRENLESILEKGLLPNEVDGCVFMTKNFDKLKGYAEVYKMEDAVVLEVNSLKLKKNSFRQSFANQNSIDDVVYLEVVKPEAIRVLE